MDHFSNQQILKQKKEMEKQQHRFFNIVDITSARALEVFKIEQVATFLDYQCVNVVERIVKDNTSKTNS
jgi:hypothetical protein